LIDGANRSGRDETALAPGRLIRLPRRGLQVSQLQLAKRAGFPARSSGGLNQEETPKNRFSAAPAGSSWPRARHLAGLGGAACPIFFHETLGVPMRKSGGNDGPAVPFGERRTVSSPGGPAGPGPRSLKARPSSFRRALNSGRRICRILARLPWTPVKPMSFRASF